MTVADNHRALLQAFEVIPDRQERLALIVARARRRAALPVQKKTVLQRVPGCVSPVWVDGSVAGGRMHFTADAEAPVVKGLVVLLCDLYEQATPADVAASEPSLLEDLDLMRDLSPTRRRGLAAVRQRIRSLAAAQLTLPIP